MFFFFHRTDPVNNLIVVIKYVVSLLYSKISKTLAYSNTTIAKLVGNRYNLSFLFKKRHILN